MPRSRVVMRGGLPLVLIGSESEVTPLKVRKIARQRVDRQVRIRHRIVRQHRIGEPLQMHDAVVILRYRLASVRGLYPGEHPDGGGCRLLHNRPAAGSQISPRRARGTDILSTGSVTFSEDGRLITTPTDGLDIWRQRFRSGSQVAEHLRLMLIHVQAGLQHNPPRSVRS